MFLFFIFHSWLVFHVIFEVQYILIFYYILFFHYFYFEPANVRYFFFSMIFPLAESKVSCFLIWNKCVAVKPYFSPKRYIQTSNVFFQQIFSFTSVFAKKKEEKLYVFFLFYLKAFSNKKHGFFCNLSFSKSFLF